MFLESGVVVILCFILWYLFVRAGRKATAMAILPLVVLPLFNIMGQILSPHLARLGLLGILEWQVLFVFLGLLAGGALFGGISRNIVRATARRGYLILCGGFTVLFAFTIIISLLPNLNFG